MKKGVVIETVMLRINGGQLNDESAVKRMDIRAYLPAAVNYAALKTYYTNIQSENNRDFPSTFYGYFPDLVIQKNKEPYFINLPKSAMALPSNQGIRFLTDDDGNTYTPLPDGAMHTLNYYLCQMSDIRFYRLRGKTINLYNLPNTLIKTVNAEIIVDPTDLADEDELPIQAGLETDVIDILVQFMTGQRQLPADKKIDKADINTP